MSRIADHHWKKGLTTVDRFKHGYDRAGNQQYREHVNAPAGYDEHYTYDHLHRLGDVDRGNLNPAKDGIAAGSLAFAQGWDLDALGTGPASTRTVQGPLGSFSSIWHHFC